MKEALRSFRVATWLGWQIESNWTDPFLFFVYSIVKPVSSVMILVVMYWVITRTDTTSPYFAYMYLGNAAYIYVGSILVGVSWAVIDDREHYQTLKYIYVSPIKFYYYLLGRGMARFLTGTLSVAITLAFGLLVLRLPIRLEAVNWPYLAASTLLGLASLAVLGLLLGAATLQMARHYWSVGESVTGALYLFCGAIFPLDALPAWLQPLGFALPLTYWLESLRRAVLGSEASRQISPSLAGIDDGQLLLILLVSTLLAALLSGWFFRWSERRAQEKGLIDVTTHY
ncbi:MAG: ABC transporter permease [Chloroflexi bacterium]|nr:MAG: ABC transporter permease [Chloroflexota bacterium]